VEEKGQWEDLCIGYMLEGGWRAGEVNDLLVLIVEGVGWYDSDVKLDQRDLVIVTLVLLRGLRARSVVLCEVTVRIALKVPKRPVRPAMFLQAHLAVPPLLKLNSCKVVIESSE
jgi:hypothetical protein